MNELPPEIESIESFDQVRSTAEISERPAQPVESSAVVERHDDRLIITIAPLGIRSADEASCSGLVGFALLWTIALVLMTLIITISPALGIPGNREAGEKDAPPMGLLLGLFWLVGTIMWLIIVHRGRRGAVLTLCGKGLTIMQTGLVFRRRHWPLEAIMDIRAQRSYKRDGDSDEGWWTTHLCIYPSSGTPDKLLGYRPPAELEWLATILRQALGSWHGQSTS